MASKIVYLVTLGFLAVGATVIEHDGDEGPLSNTCLKCIYEVIGTEGDSCSGTRCGPLQISFSQWQTAYNIRGTDDTDYVKCVENVWCAIRTVQEYMSKTLPLCVRRTPPTDSFRSVCESALILHTGTEASCRTESDTGIVGENRDKLLTCLDRRALAWLSEGSDANNDEGSGDGSGNGSGDGSGNGKDIPVQEDIKELNVLKYLNAM